MTEHTSYIFIATPISKQRVRAIYFQRNHLYLQPEIFVLSQSPPPFLHTQDIRLVCCSVFVGEKKMMNVAM